MTRTFAMRVFATTYWMLVLLFLYVLVAILLPALASSPEAAAFMPVMLVFLALLVAAAAATTFWDGATRRAWVWLVALVPAALFLLMNLPYMPYPLTHPTDSAGFTAALGLVVGVGVLVVSGVAAFREVRSRVTTGTAEAAAQHAPGRAGLVLGIVAGAVAGAVATAQLAGASGGGGAAVGQAPTVTASLVAKDTKFGPIAAEVAAGDVLGLFVVNDDAYAHSFDIDSLDIHVSLPPNSTTAVTLAPTAAGALEFYCGIPAHRSAGMAGTIDIR